MSTFLPKDVQEGLDAARRLARARKSRLRVRMGEQSLPVLRLWDSGFALDAGTAPRLRGLVDVYEGTRHLCQCLVVASSQDGGEMVYDFKRATAAADHPARDFYRDESGPVGYLGRD